MRNRFDNRTLHVFVDGGQLCGSGCCIFSEDIGQSMLSPFYGAFIGGQSL